MFSSYDFTGCRDRDGFSVIDVYTVIGYRCSIQLSVLFFTVIGYRCLTLFFFVFYDHAAVRTVVLHLIPAGLNRSRGHPEQGVFYIVVLQLSVIDAQHTSPHVNIRTRPLTSLILEIRIFLVYSSNNINHRLKIRIFIHPCVLNTFVSRALKLCCQYQNLLTVVLP